MNYSKPMILPPSTPVEPKAWDLSQGTSAPVMPSGPQAGGPVAPPPWGSFPPPWAPPRLPDPQGPSLPDLTGPVVLPSLSFSTQKILKVEEEPLYKRVAQSIAAIPKRFGKKQVKRTHIIFVLDSSGSMLNGKEITISGFNEQVDIIQQQKKGAGRTTASLILFNTTVTIPYVYKTAKVLTKLSDSSYRPTGLTALYDAVGAAMDKIIEGKGFKEKNTAFFVVILTDGQENYSKLYHGELISTCMSLLQDTGRVTFSFMGPNKNLNSIADVLKIAPGNIAGFNPESLGSRTEAFASMANATRSYLSARTEGLTSVNNLYTQNAKGLLV